MKTGRVRKKETVPEPKETTSPEPSTRPPASKPAYRPRPQGIQPQQPKQSFWILGVIAAIFVCLLIFVIFVIIKGGTDEWVKANRANGSWTTTVTVLGPQIQIQETWETECVSNPNGAVRVGTCVLQDAQTYQDRVVDDYEEYAYNIYHEETWDKTYQAQGTEFVATALGMDDWWEENLHYTRVEELDKDSCVYTRYTLWIDDPNNTTQETEVFLAECEVWDHIVVKERIYDQKSWCQCDMTTLVQIGSQSEQGTGLDVVWPSPDVPAGGHTEQAFKGQVTFVGDDHTFTTTTDNLNKYEDYMTSQYYIGLNDGRPIEISKNPKD